MNYYTFYRIPHTSNGKGFLPEKFIDSFLDLIFWGHEHECLIDPIEAQEGQFFITQPGSSVATALSQSESIPK